MRVMLIRDMLKLWWIEGDGGGNFLYYFVGYGWIVLYVVGGVDVGELYCVDRW